MSLIWPAERRSVTGPARARQKKRTVCGRPRMSRQETGCLTQRRVSLLAGVYTIAAARRSITPTITTYLLAQTNWPRGAVSGPRTHGALSFGCWSKTGPKKNESAAWLDFPPPPPPPPPPPLWLGEVSESLTLLAPSHPPIDVIFLCCPSRGQRCNTSHAIDRDDLPLLKNATENWIRGPCSSSSFVIVLFPTLLLPEGV